MALEILEVFVYTQKQNVIILIMPTGRINNNSKLYGCSMFIHFFHFFEWLWIFLGWILGFL